MAQRPQGGTCRRGHKPLALVIAEKEPDDLFRSQTDVSDRREVQGVIACQDRGAEREPDGRFRSHTVDCDRQEVQDG